MAGGVIGRVWAGGWLLPGASGRMPVLTARGGWAGLLPKVATGSSRHPVTATASRASIGPAIRPRNTRRCSTGTSVRPTIASTRQTKETKKFGFIREVCAWVGRFAKPKTKLAAVPQAVDKQRSGRAAGLRQC